MMDFSNWAAARKTAARAGFGKEWKVLPQLSMTRGHKGPAMVTAQQRAPTRCADDFDYLHETFPSIR